MQRTLHHYTAGYGAIGSDSIPQNIALHNHAGNVPNLGASAYLTAAEAQPKSVPATTALDALHEKVATAVGRAQGILNDADAFANRVGVSRPPNDRPAPAPMHDPGSTTVTHMLHGAADELHRVLSGIEDILGALRQHA